MQSRKLNEIRVEKISMFQFLPITFTNAVGCDPVATRLLESEAGAGETTIHKDQNWQF